MATSAWYRPSVRHAAAALRLGRSDDGRHFGERALGDGIEQCFAGGEVHVDGRTHYTRPTGNLRHARVRVVAQGVDRGVEYARDAALGIRAPARPTGFR